MSAKYGCVWGMLSRLIRWVDECAGAWRCVDVKVYTEELTLVDAMMPEFLMDCTVLFSSSIVGLFTPLLRE